MSAALQYLLCDYVDGSAQAIRLHPDCSDAAPAVQAGLAPVLVEVLLIRGLLDPVSARTGFRVSEECVLILANLYGHPAARVIASPWPYTVATAWQCLLECDPHVAEIWVVIFSQELGDPASMLAKLITLSLCSTRHSAPESRLRPEHLC